jgi:PAS domain S-box-containing protein
MLVHGDYASIAYSHGYTPEFEPTLRALRVPLVVANYQYMLTTGKPCLIADTRSDPDWVLFPEFGYIRSYLGVPIRAHGLVIGFLNLESFQPDVFTQTHAERLRAFADQAALAIENAQLYETIYRDAREMVTLHRATSFLFNPALFVSDSLTGVAQDIAATVVSEFGKVDCGVIVLDPETKAITRLARSGILDVHPKAELSLDGPGLVPTALRNGKPVYAPDVCADPRYVANHQATRSELVIPLRTAKGVIGVLDLQSAEVNAFDERDQRLLGMFAERVGVMIENIQLYNQSRQHASELEERVQERTAELMRVKERAEAILNHSSDAILLIRADGAIQKTNRAFDALFGFSVDQTYGAHFAQLADLALGEAFETHFKQAMELRQSSRFESRVRRVTGETFDADVMLSPIRGTLGEIRSVVCSIRDISERKRMEEELRDALARERELNEMKSRFVTRASHEFRTPLAVIMTASDLLKRYAERMTPEQRNEKIERLQREVRTLTLMLDDLLTISAGTEQPVRLSPDAIRPADVLSNTIETVQNSIGLAHHFDVSIPEAPQSIVTDVALVKRILLNLLSNAVKYSPAGSTIHVRLHSDDAQLALEVEDHGIGIPQSDQTRLFEAFYRAKNAELIEGTGLGLAIVRQAVELLGGTITFRSQVGVGTAFMVTLPNLKVKENAV